MLAITRALPAMKKRQPPPQEDPLFRTQGGALRFALNYSRSSLKKSGVVALMGGGGKGRGLGGLDGAAQAAMIQVKLGGLSILRCALLVARYSVASAPCSCRAPCCCGHRENPHWAAAIDWLTSYVLDEELTGDISHHGFRRALVARHFGVRESFIKIAETSGVERHTASRQFKKITEHLKVQENLAKQVIDEVLREAKLVGDL